MPSLHHTKANYSALRVAERLPTQKLHAQKFRHQVFEIFVDSGSTHRATNRMMDLTNSFAFHDFVRGDVNGATCL